MEPTQRLALLEAEIAELEGRLAALAASSRAAATEANAARDPGQFAPRAFTSWMVRLPGPTDHAAMLGLFCGAGAGFIATIAIGIIGGLVRAALR